MTCEEYLSNMKPGYIVDGGSEEHLVMHELSQRALKITMELNNKYHTKEEIVQLALPYEILLQHASIVSCLCVFGISHFGLYYLYSSTTFQLAGSRCEHTMVLFLCSLRFSSSSNRILISRSSVMV